jgi:kynurenine formamidase
MALEWVDRLASARVYDLGRPLHRGMPNWPSHPPYLFSLMFRHDDHRHADESHGSNELIVLSGHTGTHIDGLGHIGCAGHLFGGVDAVADSQGGHGYRSLGIERMAPLVGRGVLLDVARLRGVAALEPDAAVTAEDLAAAERLAGVSVGGGDVVLIHTGWGEYWEDGPRYVGLGTGLPGPDLEAARWLSARAIRATGSDTIVYERLPPAWNELPVHVHLIAERGIPIMENLDLGELAANQIGSFGFVALPLKLVGATGSPIRPIAVV